MPETVDAIPQDVLTDICAFCGIAIYNGEIAAEFTGNMIDYGMVGAKGTWHGGFVLCGECWQRVRESMACDMEKAVERRQRLDDNT